MGKTEKTEYIHVSPRSPIAVLACCLCLLGAAPALGASSTGTPEQVAWVRSAATRFVTAELDGNGAGACAVLNAPLRATVRGRTCEQRWNARIAGLLRTHGERSHLRAQLHEIATARVTVNGNVASIALPSALMSSPEDRFLWTENCWMLEG
ncbi:MAG TPA: hypothetical protein VKG62_07000 [Solirubrobacteraceae bacterium]|nr:hypothetical protein [Solirubrobacteraceae bacterium]